MHKQVTSFGKMLPYFIPKQPIFRILQPLSSAARHGFRHVPQVEFVFDIVSVISHNIRFIDDAFSVLFLFFDRRSALDLALIYAFDVKETITFLTAVLHKY